ncbi:MAG TPA: shikimate dehydrogenase [Caulobacteraceae bacterium]|jgi:shikimate dehydrogenase|nr:shikimate dehydrogenase [Caulobacteraceae bacterium]
MSKRSYLIGLIGAGIQASRSPFMHEQAGRRQGFDYSYRLIDLTTLGLGVGALPDLVAQAEREGFDGLNITHPCKQAVIPLLDELSDEAREIGAVNTVVLRDGRRIGHNTDWWGFIEGLRSQLPDAPTDRLLQLGAGGAGSATAYALLKIGAGRLLIFDTHPERAQGLAAKLNRRFGEGRVSYTPDPVASAAVVQGIVQATSIGQVGYPGLPIPAEALIPEHWVAEIIYFPLETEFLRTARALGCRAADGAGMGVFQAVGAFEHFTGVRPDSAAMKRDFIAAGAR